MNLVFAEAVVTELLEDKNGNKLCHARVLDPHSNKYKIINHLFENSTISYFLKIGDCLNYFLKNDTPLVFVTDWTDPTEMVGLRLESENEVIDYPNLSFLAFNSNWDDIKKSGIEEIFAHEFSHLWLNLLGYDFELSKSNKFHTCTAITDPFMAFSEGFAEHLEIVTKDLVHNVCLENKFWDYGYDVNAWLCLRDEQLRYHAVINNRFIYHTALPYCEDWNTYNHLHFAHITSSAFTPEKLKNGNQMMASEGVISSIFYQMYKHELFKSEFIDDKFYSQFGINKNELAPLTNLYLKMIFILSKIDLKKTTLMIDFIRSYGDEFPNEKKDLYDVFLNVTHYSTVSLKATEDFGNLYRIGRRGEVVVFKDILRKTKELKQDLYDRVLSCQLSLDNALAGELWIESDAVITPIPWSPEEKTKYHFDINTATEIDLLSLDGLTLEHAKILTKERDSKHGFTSIEEFYNLLRKL
ncbi:helix-hairpin-helix domain-containing protein [Clostridium sp. CS001]|uniref:helix-hairpin-helix domain-containing protein n=1 Tax=Clostridium sp. CS001 TaxID=2880648 RepID=UPI001CF43D4C|nr:helix-hairpin-helix domain-containing protein [Clostridium sp. CS001]MCB2290889.1 helix-hairpin-helix domain-containing protein [Clostridium sp. CS001]